MAETTIEFTSTNPSTEVRFDPVTQKDVSISDPLKKGRSFTMKMIEGKLHLIKIKQGTQSVLLSDRGWQEIENELTHTDPAKNIAEKIKNLSTEITSKKKNLPLHPLSLKRLNPKYKDKRFPTKKLHLKSIRQELLKKRKDIQKKIEELTKRKEIFEKGFEKTTTTIDSNRNSYAKKFTQMKEGFFSPGEKTKKISTREDISEEEKVKWKKISILIDHYRIINPKKILSLPKPSSKTPSPISKKTPSSIPKSTNTTKTSVTLPIKTPKGIPNVENTCWANAALQMIAHTPELRDFVLNCANAKNKSDAIDKNILRTDLPDDKFNALKNLGRFIKLYEQKATNDSCQNNAYNTASIQAAKALITIADDSSMKLGEYIDARQIITSFLSYMKPHRWLTTITKHNNTVSTSLQEEDTPISLNYNDPNFPSSFKKAFIGHQFAKETTTPDDAPETAHITETIKTYNSDINKSTNLTDSTDFYPNRFYISIEKNLKNSSHNKTIPFLLPFVDSSFITSAESSNCTRVYSDGYINIFQSKIFY